MNLFFLCVLVILFAATECVAAKDLLLFPHWNISPSESHITVAFQQMGTGVKAEFQSFSGDIVFDQDHLEQSHVIIDVDTKSFVSGDKDRDNTAHTKEWFDTEHFPSARFESMTFKKAEDNKYIADGTLTIKETSRPLSLPFSLSLTKLDSGNTKAQVSADIVLDRSAFDLGIGSWADKSLIANDVALSIYMTAKKKK